MILRNIIIEVYIYNCSNHLDKFSKLKISSIYYRRTIVNDDTGKQRARARNPAINSHPRLSIKPPPVSISLNQRPSHYDIYILKKSLLLSSSFCYRIPRDPHKIRNKTNEFTIKKRRATISPIKREKEEEEARLIYTHARTHTRVIHSPKKEKK